MGIIIKDILTSLINQGIVFEVSGDKLLIKGDLSAISDENKKILKENKEAIIAVLNKTKNSIPLIEKAADENNLPLSYSQQSLWLLDKINGGSSHYNLSAVFELEGKLDVTSIEKTFKEIVERHKILRTCFHIDDSGEPKQVIQSSDKFHLKQETLKADSLNEKEQLITKIQEDISQPFNLEEDILLRVNLLQLSNSNYIMTVSMHHIASDGWSMGILVKEFNELYPCFLENKKIDLPELNINYFDYASWQRKWLKEDVLADYVKYWTNQLQDAPQIHSLPVDKKRPLIQDFKGKTYKTILDHTDLEHLKKICKEEEVTLFMALHSIFSVLISRYSNESDIVIGTPIANREQPEIQGLVGFFMNLLVLRLDMSDNPTFRQLLRKSKKVLLEAYQYQQMPFDKLVEELKVERGLGHSPLFQILLSLDNNETESFSLPNLEMKAFQNITEDVSKYDLSLNVKETSEGLVLCWEYSTNLFLDQTIEKMAAHFSSLLRNIIKNTDENIYTLDIVSDEDLKGLLIKGEKVNTNELIYAFESFLEQVNTHPDNTSVVFKDKEYTNREFLDLVNSIGNLLHSKGVKQGDKIGICMFRNVEMIASIFACFKLGAAYVPLDPSYPSERILQIVEEADPKVIITESVIQKLYADFLPVDTCCFLDEELIVTASNSNEENLNLSKETTAYIMFTSGTTGKPKGIEITHLNLANLLYSLDDTFGNDIKRQTWLAQTSINFDISVLELIWTLSRGHKVVLQQSNPINLYAGNSAVSDKKMAFSVLFFGADKNEEATGKYDLLLEIAKWIDDKEFEAIWTPERHFSEFGGAFPSPSVLGAAIAMVTKNIAIRAGSVVLPMHDPIRVAEEWAVVDNLSSGRVGISVASGWHPNDFVFADGDYKNRHSQMKAKVEELKKLWKGDSITRINGVGAEISLQVRPVPQQKKLPLWVTSAGNKETFIYAGQIGANVLTHMLGQNLEQLEENIKIYHQTLLDNGFSVEESKITLMLHTYIDETPELAHSISEKPFKSYLTSSIKLMEPLAAELGLDINTQLNEIVDIAYLRFSRNNTLIGTEKTFQEMTSKLSAIGINEVACLVDFGIENSNVLESLKRVSKAKDKHEKELAKAAVIDVTNYKTELQLIQEHEITHVQMTPSQTKIVVKQLEQNNTKNISQVKYWLMGGEPITQDIVRSLSTLTQSKSFNMYGPTETTVWSAWREINEHDFNISGVISNTTFVLLNSHKKPVPQGVAGELYIGGEGVAKGYYNNKSLTEEKFLEIKFDKADNERFYRTGDLMRLNFDGNFEYIGRKDDQVKINGYRIEIEDIEKNILQLPGVQDCKIVAMEGDYENYLSAFAVLPSIVHKNYTNLPLEKQAKAYKFPDNSVVYHQSDRQLSMLYKEIFEDEIYFKHNIQLSDNPIVMDIGSNIGTFSMHVKQKFPEAYVVAFEPIPQIFSALKKNFEHRNIRGKILNYGISDKTEQAVFHYYPEMAGMSGRFATQETILEAVEKYIDFDKTSLLKNEDVIHADLQLAKSFYETLDNKVIQPNEIRDYLETIYQSEEVECELTTVSNIISELKLPYIDLLKIDVEKSEHLVVKGILDQHWTIIKQIVIEVDGDNNLEFITAKLIEKGFEIINDELVMTDNKVKNEDNTYLLYAFNKNFVYPDSNNFFEESPQINSEKIKDFLTEKLPGYMVPKEINIIPVMPLLMNGKIDVKKLKSFQPKNEEQAPVKLENKTEMAIYKIWSEVLKKENIPPHISIFEAGGNSLQMIVLHEKLQKEFAVEFSVIDLFRNPTIALQAKLVTNSVKKDVNNVKKALQKGASRRNIIRNKQN